MASTLGNNIALATAVVIVMFWNFFVNRYWTYRDVDLDRWSEVQPAGVTENPASQEGR
jgi:putative flippase GtrA